MQKEFNLLYEPWIRVLDASGQEREVSLLGAISDAHNIKRLAGELPVQDVAILRLLLAALYCVFTRFNTNGGQLSLDSEDMAHDRWRELWVSKKFPMVPVEKYFCTCEDRFYLIHPKTPFYQIAGLNSGTVYSAAKLIGDVSESGNKLRLFANRSGEAKLALEYPEAARWLLYLNAFDDTSSKPTRGGDKKISVGAGYLGKLGLVYASGANLFETLMLNLILSPQGGGAAVWEREPCVTERREIPCPTSYAELFTLQSRRILLSAENGLVKGYTLQGGDVFDTENAFIEYMTLWRRDSVEKDVYRPARHSSTKSFWRDFAALTATGGGTRRPGIVDRICLLRREGLIKLERVSFNTAGVKYGDKDFFVDDVFGDSISLNSEILMEICGDWSVRICDNLKKTEYCVRQLKKFARELELARGYSPADRYDTKSSIEQVAQRAYFDLDTLFRAWLTRINPNTDDADAVLSEWMETVRKLLLRQAYQLLNDAGTRALTGEHNAVVPLNVFEHEIYRLTKAG